MPSVPLYIREEDYEQWKAIEKKSEFIHDALIMAKLPPEVLKTQSPPKATKEPIKQPLEKLLSGKGMAPSITGTIPYRFPPSAASQLEVIKTPEQAKKAVDNPKFIDKKYSARKSKDKHVEL